MGGAREVGVELKEGQRQARCPREVALTCRAGPEFPPVEN